jgi:predicted anti-sigma-YlaC factor YlaD
MGGGRHPNDWERQREQLSAYIDGELSAAERAQLERHIPGCPECQEALGELRRVHDLLAALPTPNAPRSFALPLDIYLPARSAPQQAATRRSRAGLIQWAGAIAATIGLFLLLGSALAGLPGLNSKQSAASSRNSDTTLTGAQSQTPAATASGQRTPEFNSTQQPQVGDKSTPGAATTPTGAATPTSSATSVSPEVASSGPDIPVLPITGGGLLVIGAGVYLIGRSQRRREEHAA